MKKEPVEVSAKELLKNPAIFKYLHKLVGDEGIGLIYSCPKEELSDEEIAEQTEINLNSVRHSLYNLYEHRLAEYRRIKNNETGWLTYLWKLRLDNIDSVLKAEMKVAAEKLAARLKYDENNDFYQCKNCGTMLTFNNAMEENFVCPQCGDMLAHFDAELLVAALARRVKEMNNSLSEE
ncbi:MAG TPA: transcription factor [Methanocorpusculum sp.]|nr:transcription factor [Methanocorpusculum sp.]